MAAVVLWYSICAGVWLAAFLAWEVRDFARRRRWLRVLVLWPLLAAAWLPLLLAINLQVGAKRDV